MFTEFHKYGLRFQYPEFWETGEVTNDDSIIISVNSPETTFWMVNLFPGQPEPQIVIDSTVAAYREEYDELDVYDADDELFNDFEEFVGCDIDFICLELTNSVSMRVFRSETATVLVLTQGTDHELETTQPILDQISQSLSLD